MSYFLPLRPSNLNMICSAGLFSRQRKHLRFASSSLLVFAADETILAGLNWSLTVRPPISTSLTLTSLSARKLPQAKGHCESWSPTNLCILSCFISFLLQVPKYGFCPYRDYWHLLFLYPKQHPSYPPICGSNKEHHKFFRFCTPC